MVGKYKNSILLRMVLAVIPLLVLTSIFASGQTSADVLKSSHYQLQPTVGNSFGGSVGSSNYKLTDSGGEAVIGNGAGGSYRIGAGFVAELQHSINLYVEPSGLTAYYPLNEGAGPTVHDASANSNDGTASGTNWVDGQIGKALQFTGSATSDVIAKNITDFPTSAITNSFWIKTGASGQQFWISFSPAGGNDWLIGGPTNMVIYRDGAKTSTGVSVNDGQWHYITITWRGSDGQLKVYKDGTQAYTGTLAAGTTIAGGGSGCLVFGQDQDALCGGFDSSQALNGSLDDVKFFNRILNADEVEANYEAGLAGLDSGLVIPAIKAGNSQTVGADVIVSADAPYSLLTNETGLLTLFNGSATIPSISGTVASPAAWQEGITKGLGFTVLSGPSASPAPAKWASGADYAAVPADATSFYNRSGFTGGAKDVVKLQYRLDVSGAQAAGQYKNDVVYTATETP